MCFHGYVNGSLLSNDDFSFSLPDIKNVGMPTLEVFTTLSQIVTLHQFLDKKSVETLFNALLKEHSNQFNILKTYKALRALLLKGVKKENLQHQIQKGNIAKGEKWFVQHLITTWYTGIYYVEGQEPIRLFHQEALVWKPLKGIVPIPFVENIDFGLWSKHPSDIKGEIA